MKKLMVVFTAEGGDLQMCYSQGGEDAPILVEHTTGEGGRIWELELTPALADALASGLRELLLGN